MTDLRGGKSNTAKNQQKSLKYFLEKSDGELIQHSLPVDGSVEQLLSSISSALETTGLTLMKPPHQTQSSSDQGTFNNDSNLSNSHGNILSQDTTRINHSYDVNSNRGRHLLHFINNLDKNEIEQRKADRIDATAAALVARQAFKFQSIDGTQLGWSSSSLAKTLRMLTKAFDEHNDKFNVDSFYPLQLIFSNDEFHNKLDLFGGTIMLNPGSTQEQWLETLMAVTSDDLKVLEINRKNQKNNLVQAQNYLNANIKKGFSCSSKEYYDFLDRLADEGRYHCMKSERTESKSNDLALDRLRIVVETSQACRRPVITNTGDIRISSTASASNVISSIHKLRSDALRNILLEKEQIKRAKDF